MEVRIEKIGPERAKILLSTTRNRRLNPPHSAKFARDMEAGNWRPNSTIQIAKTADGECLIDGQHRLQAVIITGRPQEFIVIYDVSVDDQAVIDTGRRRSLSDTLAIRGEANTSLLAAAVAYIWREQQNLPPGSKMTPTIAEGLRLLGEHSALKYGIQPTRIAVRQLRVPPGLACYLYYRMAGIDADCSDDFWHKLGTGLDLHARHPIYLLRGRLEANAASTTVKLGSVVIHALAIKAWNAYVRGDEIGTLRWTRGGPTPQPFPELEGPID